MKGTCFAILIWNFAQLSYAQDAPPAPAVGTTAQQPIDAVAQQAEGAALPPPPPAHQIWVDTNIVVSEVSFNAVDLRTALLGLAKGYSVNLFVEPDVKATLTLHLRDIRFNDVLQFIVGRYGLRIWKDGEIVTVSAPVVVPKPTFTLEVRNDSVWLDAQGTPAGQLARALTEQSNRNFLVIPADSGQAVTGLVKGVPLEGGLVPFLAVNGLDLVERAGTSVLSRRAEASGQPGLARKEATVTDSGITLSVVNEPLAKLVPSLLERAGVNWFVYGVLPGNVTADFVGLPLDACLHRLLMGTDYGFALQQDGYIIGPKTMEGVTVSQLLPLKYLVVTDLEKNLPTELLKPLELKLVPEQNAFVAVGPFGPVADLAAYVAEVDQPVAQVLFEILMVDYTDDFLSEWKLTVDNSGGASETAEFDQFFPEVNVGDKATNLEREATNFLGDLGIRYVGGLPDSWFVKLHALVSEGKVKIRSRPTIATRSGHEASITVGTTQYYLLETETTYGVNQTSPTTQISRQFTTIEANMDVNVKPWVTGNGEVVVEITPEFKTPRGVFSSEVPPTIDHRTLKSSVRLRDGETIVLGGLRQELESQQTEKFPILGSIPVLGWLFQNRTKQREDTELMIYITPRIYYGSEGAVQLDSQL